MMDNDCSATRVHYRNLRIYALQIALLYLAAPVQYVGVVHSALCKRLATSDALANLPGALFVGMAWFPVVIVWLLPQVRLLKTMLATAYGVMASSGALVASLLCASSSSTSIVGALMVHGALLGCADGTVSILGWEVLDRGVATHLRGKALGLAFGLGPVCAATGSLAAQLLLDGQLFGWRPPAWLAVAYPANYVILFAISASSMAVACLITQFYRIPLPKVESEREALSAAFLDGFKAFCRNRILLLACIVYLLTYCGNMVQINMSLFAREAIGRTPEEVAGYQLALRFTSKIGAGLLLGWILTRTHPKFPLLCSIGLQIVGVVWVLAVPGYWFLFAFALNGAGELFGVYGINYAVCCSRTSDVRRNLAFLMLLSSAVGVFAVSYGWISDHWSLSASFWVALGLLVATFVFALKRLPSNPQPEA